MVIGISGYDSVMNHYIDLFLGSVYIKKETSLQRRILSVILYPNMENIQCIHIVVHGLMKHVK